MDDRANAIMRIARSIADGEPVDWQAEHRPDPGFNAQIEHLRTVEGIASTHRAPALGARGAAAAALADLPTEQIRPAGDDPTHWGKLRILGRIGEGGFARVYRAYDPTLQREVALKLPHPDRARSRFQARRFIEEARRLARVRHDNVVIVHGAEEHDGRVGLWTDLLEGETLEQCLQKRGAFGPREAALIGIDLCRALAAVHHAGLVHRDVKTANVMRTTDGRIVLLDFSTVSERVVGPHGNGGDRITGTIPYMAPELFRGEDSGVAVDIYAFGVVLYRLVSKRFPVEAASLPELIATHDRRGATPVLDVRPDLPQSFVRLIDRALDPVPTRRYQSAGQMEQDLGAVAGTRVAPEPHPAPPTPWWRRTKSLAAAAGVVMLAAAVFLVPGLLPVAPLEAEATLFRVGGGGEERLPPGGVIRPGDRLFLEIRGSRPMHVYIVDEDMRGQQALLFPLPGLEQQNPLPPGRHRLPGRLSGQEHAWTVTSPGGSEVISLLASREPVPGLDRILAGISTASPGAPIEVTSEMLTRFRGINGLSPAPEGQSQRRLLSGAYRDRFGEAGARGVWFWEIELRNPGDAGN